MCESADLPTGAAAFLRRNRSERGIALVTVLWTMALLSVLIIGFTSESRMALRLARNEAEGAKARALAEAGFSLAVLALTRPVPEDRSAFDFGEQRFTLGDGEVYVRLEDEVGKIDVNAAPPEVVEGLLRVAGADDAQAAEITRAIMDRRPQEVGVAAGQSTLAARFLDISPSRSIADLDELREFPGMTSALFARARPFLTTWTRSARIDLGRAAPELLRALPGIVPAELEDFLARRSVDGPAAAPPPSGVRYHSRRVIRPVTVVATARTAAGYTYRRRAVVTLTRTPASPYRILSWGTDIQTE